MILVGGIQNKETVKSDITPQELKSLVLKLKAIKLLCDDDGWVQDNSRHGLCYLVSGRLNGQKYTEKLAETFQSWEHYSGNPVYPVPFPVNRGNILSRMYYRVRKWLYVYVDGWPVEFLPFRAFGTMNLWKGEYGKLRKDLLDHAIIHLQKELDSVKESQ